MLDEWKQLEPLKNTRYPLERLPTITQWITTNAPPATIRQDKGYNWDFDYKRRPVGVTETKGRITFSTVAWQDAVEYTEWRDGYFNLRRGVRSDGEQIGDKNKITTLDDWQEFARYVAARASGLSSIA